MLKLLTIEKALHACEKSRKNVWENNGRERDGDSEKNILCKETLRLFTPSLIRSQCSFSYVCMYVCDGRWGSSIKLNISSIHYIRVGMFSFGFIFLFLKSFPTPISLWWRHEHVYIRRRYYSASSSFSFSLSVDDDYDEVFFHHFLNKFFLFCHFLFHTHRHTHMITYTPKK